MKRPQHAPRKTRQVIMTNKEITTKDLKQFGVALSIILGIFGGIHFLKGHVSAYPWFFWIALTILFLGVIVPRFLRPIFIVFTKIAHAIGWFNTRVILVIVYYLVLTPIGLVLKIFGKDILDIKAKENTQTYWKERKNIKTQLTKQF